MSRLLSHSEIDSAMTCWARHAFAYTGHLTDDTTLKPKGIAPILSEGRAWGAAVAAWHAHGSDLLGFWAAFEALRDSLDSDEREMAERGFPVDILDGLETEGRLGTMLEHYAATTEQLPNLTRLEDEVVVSIPSRKGGRASTRYKFLCRIDGFTDRDGQRWLVEFKLRRGLQPVELIQRSRQIRWYAWALSQTMKEPPIGVLVDERLNEVPRPARILKSGYPSHAVDQITTPELYVDACHAADTPPKASTVDALGARAWQQRVPIMFRPGELDEAGHELVSVAKLIRDLDSGELAPIRHATRMTCQGCAFKGICDNPEDEHFVNLGFERTVPKRLRIPNERTG